MASSQIGASNSNLVGKSTESHPQRATLALKRNIVGRQPLRTKLPCGAPKKNNSTDMSDALLRVVPSLLPKAFAQSISCIS